MLFLSFQRYNVEEIRSLSGYQNNLGNPTWGMAGTELLRISTPSYADGISVPSGGNRPNPRTISDTVLTQIANIPNRKAASDYLWVWGQFLDHDIGITESASPLEPFPIQIPKGDPYFDIAYTGTQIIPLFRSIYSVNPTDPDSPRQQLNLQSSYIDASNIYGASDERARTLRRNDGTGRLRTGINNLLPHNTHGLHNAPDNSSRYYLAGDIRANEQVLLIAMHTLWMREHNRIAHQLWINNPEWTDEQIYQEARTYVIALNQAITFNEYLPLMFGPMTPYKGYDPNINPQIFNEFSTACYRLGHSQVSSQLLRLRADLQSTAEGPLPLRDAFFTPELINESGGIDPFLRGAAFQVCQEVDARTVDELRNFLFGNPGEGGMDLAALNIQRGRDHGFPSYNEVRQFF
jgi:hypothetical protein